MTQRLLLVVLLAVTFICTFGEKVRDDQFAVYVVRRGCITDVRLNQDAEILYALDKSGQPDFKHVIGISGLYIQLANQTCGMYRVITKKP